MIIIFLHTFIHTFIVYKKHKLKSDTWTLDLSFLIEHPSFAVYSDMVFKELTHCFTYVTAYVKFNRNLHI